MVSQISSQFAVTAIGTQTIASLAAALAAVPIDVDRLRKYALFPQSDGTSTVSETATRTIVAGMGQGGFAATFDMSPGQPSGGQVRDLALSGFSPSPWAAPPVLQFSGGNPIQQATATCQMGLNTACVVVLKGGSGYTGATTAKLVGGNLAPGGTPATLGAITIVGPGTIAAVAIATPGSGYTTYPEIVFTDSGGGSGAVAFAMLNPVGLTLTSPGKQYQSKPTLTATAPFLVSYPTGNQGSVIQGWMENVIASQLLSPVKSPTNVVS